MDLSIWEEELTGAFETPNLPRWCQPHMYNDFQISSERYEDLLLSQSGPDYSYSEEALAHWGQLPPEVTFNNDDVAFPTIESLPARRRSARAGGPEYLSQEPNDMQQQASTERVNCRPAGSDADASSRVAAASFKPDLQQEKNGKGLSSVAAGASPSMPDSSNQAASDVSEIHGNHPCLTTGFSQPSAGSGLTLLLESPTEDGPSRGVPPMSLCAKASLISKYDFKMSNIDIMTIRSRQCREASRLRPLPRPSAASNLPLLCQRWRAAPQLAHGSCRCLHQRGLSDAQAGAAAAAAGLAQPTPLEIVEEIMRLSEPREIVRLAATCKSLAARSRGIVKASAMQERFNRGVVCPTYRWTLVPRGPHKPYAFRLDSR